MKYARPELPYHDAKSPHNNRYKIMRNAHKDIGPKELDGEINYVVDSLNELDKALNEITVGFLPNSDNPDNKDKLLTTNGVKGDPTLSWVKVDTAQIKDNAIEAAQINPDAVITEKINNKAVTTNKLDDGAVTPNKVKFDFEEAKDTEENKRKWAKGIGEEDSKSHTLVARGKDGGIKVKKIDATEIEVKNIKATKIETGEITSPTITALEKKINELVVAGLKKVVDDAFDKEHPVGSYNFTNPRHGNVINGNTVHWDILDAGRVLASSGKPAPEKDLGYMGDTLIINDVNSKVEGQTKEHKLIITEMPSHDHIFGPNREIGVHWYAYQGAQTFAATGGREVGKRKTRAVGGGEGHAHKIDVKRIELPLYKRTA